MTNFRILPSVTIDPMITDDHFDYYGPDASDSSWLLAITLPDHRDFDPTFDDDLHAYAWDWAEAEAERAFMERYPGIL